MTQNEHTYLNDTGMKILCYAAILGVMLATCFIVLTTLEGHSSDEMVCIDMNGHEITPTDSLCKYACSAVSSNPHMQAHYDETCDCCRAKGIKFDETTKDYEERVYVINSDGSKGEDVTCAYYSNASGCGK